MIFHDPLYDENGEEGDVGEDQGEEKHEFVSTAYIHTKIDDGIVRQFDLLVVGLGRNVPILSLLKRNGEILENLVGYYFGMRSSQDSPRIDF